MYNVLTLNKIAAVGTKRLGDNYTCGNDVQDPDAILVRSAAMHDMELGDNLLAIARAGAGTNNIPKDKCTEQGICVFNTPGANANAVKELVLTGLLLASRKVVEGIEWAKTLKGSGDEMGKKVEKGKSQFVGPEITGKTLGVVGLGAIGILVANVAVAVGMDVIGFDPFLSEANKAKLDPAVKIMGSNEEVMVNCDYLSIHVPLLPDTKDMVDAEMIAKMRDGVRILNYSRDGLVNSEALLDALKSGKVAKYVTDFGNDTILGEENVIVIPHLGASTPESEDNCAVMACNQIKDYIENGNIVNSVNLPALSVERNGSRVTVISKADADVKSVDVAGMTGFNTKTRGGYAYTIIDGATEADAEKLAAVEGVIKVRFIG
ncbi:MAG: 3-phosphoglycerate dehydrogenase, partial [Ruminococcus sp.]|nr:3-phosphoglycerate dehydrogenase [Ruminococcus sp.]MBQ3987208.1 3-phosphoglycerate dehydrogenase [Ruminococcus sp.]